MKQERRHQCLIYAGAPAKQLTSIRILLTERLNAGYRCIYMNSSAMINELQANLTAAGVNIQEQTERGALLLSSDSSHLVNGRFEVDAMISKLQSAAIHAQTDGFEGLWVSGDMTWEFGSEENLAKLLEYECKLEQLFHEAPMLHGICQYHMDTLPSDYIQDALHSHQGVYINEALSMVNPHYIPPNILSKQRPSISDTTFQKMLKGLGIASYPVKS